MEVLLRAAAGDLARSKKQRYCTSCNAVLLPPFLTKAAILQGESDAGELLKIFTRSIMEWASDADPLSEAVEASDNDSVVTIKAAEAKKPGKAKQASAKTAPAETKNPGKAKQDSAKTAATETLATISDDCDNVLAFLQAVAVKSPRVLAALLSLCVDKRACVWFQQWTGVNLPKPPTPAPQDHMGLTDILTDVATRLHTAEALRSVVAAQREMEKETNGWDRLPPTAQRVILAASSTTPHHSPLPQREERVGPSSGLFVNLCR